MKLEQNDLLRLGLSGAFLDVVDAWGDDMLPQHCSNQELNGSKALSAIMYKHDDNWVSYTLLENGDVHRTTSESVEDGYTWNGDDVYVKAYKTIFTFHEKVGCVDFGENVDYNDDENVENIACQVVEILRDI